MSPKPVADFVSAVSASASAQGEAICNKMEGASKILLTWLSHLASNKLTGTADSLLHGVHGAVIEATGAITLGLARTSVFSMRAHIDMLLAWVYFKDHPIEWRRVEETGDGFQQKADVIKYLGEHYRAFKDRMGMLKQVKLRHEEEPYRLLSAHVHSQSSTTVPKLTSLVDMVSDTKTLEECLSLQFEFTHYL